MNPASKARPLDLDWDEFGRSLADFARASATAISVFDAQRVRMLGPMHDTHVGAVLEQAGVWAEDGWATRFELGAIEKCARSGAIEEVVAPGDLVVLAVPLRLDGEQRAFVAFGWIFRGFPGPLAAEIVSREIRLEFAEVWRAFRATAPLPSDTFVSIQRLLLNLIDSTARLTESRSRVERLLAMREVFLLKVSHELRSPLAAISLRAEALASGLINDAERRGQHLESILRSVEEFDRLVEDVIDVARSETGQLAMQRVPLPIGVPLADAIAGLSPLAQAKGVALIEDFERDEAQAVVVDGDAVRLRQVFWNIGANAIKFTPRGGSITVTLKPSARAVDIEISDTGVGIPSDELPRIFDEFQSRRSGNPSGLGLGLTIVRQIVSRHGGLVRAQSEGADQGATLTVTLPRAGVATLSSPDPVTLVS